MNSDVFNEVLAIFSKDEEWKIDENALSHDFMVRAQQKDELDARIRSLLKGEMIGKEEFSRLRLHLEYANYLSASKTQHYNAVRFLYWLNCFGIRGDGYTNDKEKWLLARKLLEERMMHTSVKLDYEPFDSVVARGDAILNLRKYGYKIELSQGRISPSVDDYNKFKESMRYLFDQLGGASVLIILNQIQFDFSSKTLRYNFRKTPPRFGTAELQIPWGFLLNVALSFWVTPRKLNAKKAKVIFTKICNISRQFFAVMEIQPLSVFEEMFRSPNESLDELQEAILYQQHMGLDQVPPNVMYLILKGMIGQHSVKKMETVYLSILKWICDKQKGLEVLDFDKEMLKQDLHDHVSDEEIDSAMDELSTESQELNHGYCDPRDFSKRNYYLRPFVKRGESYFLLSAQFFVKGFYYAWRAHYSNNREIGILFENYVADLLRSKGLTLYNNVKYSVSDVQRAEMQSIRQDGECDIIIETSKTIFFIELKKREISDEASGGDPVAALKDMSDSALFGLTQAAVHEYCLRQNGALHFKNGTTLRLNSRRIVKVHLSLFDHYALQDNVLLLRYLRAMLAFEYSCNDPSRIADIEALSKVEGRQTEFRNVMRTNVMKAAYVNINQSLMSFHSFSLPQIIFLLKNVSSNDDFEREISSTFCITTSTKDWYQEYAFVKRVREG